MTLHDFIVIAGILAVLAIFLGDGVP